MCCLPILFSPFDTIGPSDFQYVPWTATGHSSGSLIRRSKWFWSTPFKECPWLHRIHSTSSSSERVYLVFSSAATIY